MITETPRLSSTQKHVLRILKANRGLDGATRMGVPELAQETSLTERTIMRTLKILDECGVIKREGRYTRYGRLVNRYTFSGTPKPTDTQPQLIEDVNRLLKNRLKSMKRLNSLVRDAYSQMSTAYLDGIADGRLAKRAKKWLER